GIDSALTAVLAARALGAKNVTTIAMPSRYTASMSNEDAEVLARRLGVSFHTIAIEDIFQSYLAALAPLFEGRKPDVTEENLQARRLIERGFSEALGRRVLKLVVPSEYKRRQAAPALRVTARAFGEGWRFPIAHGYRH